MLDTHSYSGTSARTRHASRSRSARSSSSIVLACLLPLVHVVTAQASTSSMPARWGQASALVGSLLVIQGGKTQGTAGGGYTYSSAPSDGQMYTLDLSSAFSLSSPPWQTVSIEQGSVAAPLVSFHTISPLNSTSLLLFGGDGSPTIPVQTGNDSAYVVHLGGTASNRTAAYAPVPATWNQPMRRAWHTSESNGQGSVWITGGEKADGSGTVLDQQWTIDTTAASPSFQLVPSSPPGSLVGSTSTMLSDGTILLLGGLDSSGQLQTMQNLYAYSSKSRTWSQTTTRLASNATRQPRQNAFPAPRRDHIAVSLPDQRVFIQGGASADLSTVYSDAWILDWSVNPPVWTSVEANNGPGPRYGHAAAAYGREVLIAFGWQGGNAASTGLHVFDASTLVASASNAGSWSGGSWSATSYIPDSQMSSPSSATSGQGSESESGPYPSSSSAGGNGSSSSSGGNPSSPSDSSAGDQSNGSNSNSNSGTFPTGSTTPGTDGSAGTSSNGSSGGTKAGAAVGAIIGAGLVVGAGYAVYRRRAQNNYRRYGESKEAILGFGARHSDGSADDDYLMEKGFMQSDYNRPYHQADTRAEVAAGLTGGLAYGRKRGRTEGSPWTAGNIGHAMEGSGPHFRERIAILAGRGKRDSQAAARVDMLADEGDGSSVYTTRRAESVRRTYDDNLDEPESPTWPQRHLREHSYVNVGDGEQDLSSGDIGQFNRDDDEETTEQTMYSPFADRPEQGGVGRVSAVVGASGYGRLADREMENSYDEEHRFNDGRSDLDLHEGPSSGPSVQSHSSTSRSDVPSSSKSHNALSSGGIVSFSDASHGRHSAGSNGMKRSPTWWERFMGSSPVEHAASGRRLTSPMANLPIRDPAPPPVSGLEVITESTRSRDVSEAQENPFTDAGAADFSEGLDEMGRRINANGITEAYSAHEHGPSQSSVGSARTGASSHFESRLRGMDVIQRVRTGSSRRTQSTRTGSAMSDTDSEPALSRGPTLLRPRNVPSSEGLRDDARSTPGSVVWDPSNLRAASMALDDLAEEGEPVPRRPSNVSETPSITPLTTKRARLNPVMVSPLFPSTGPRRAAPLQAASTVRDKVKAFESVTNADTGTSAWSASLSSARSSCVVSAVPTTKDEGIERAFSPPQGSESGGRKSKLLLSHGLVPRAQLYVANPDHTRGSSSSS